LEVEFPAEVQDREDAFELLADKPRAGTQHCVHDLAVYLIADPTAALGGLDQLAATIGRVGHAPDVARSSRSTTRITAAVVSRAFRATRPAVTAPSPSRAARQIASGVKP
jgi:hypothetical protein